MSLKQIIDIAYKVIPSDLLDKFEEKVNKNSERFLETLIYELILGCNNENFNDVSKALDLITSLETYSEEIENMITEAIKNKNYPSKCNTTLYERFDMSFDIRFLESYTRQYLVTESDSDEEICLKDFSEALLRNVFKASLNESGYENIEAFFYRYNNTASNISEREWIEINKIFIEDNISLFKEIFENSFKDSIESNSKSILKLIKQSIIYEAIEIFKYLLSKLFSKSLSNLNKNDIEYYIVSSIIRIGSITFFQIFEDSFNKALIKDSSNKALIKDSSNKALIKDSSKVSIEDNLYVNIYNCQHYKFIEYLEKRYKLKDIRNLRVTVSKIYSKIYSIKLYSLI